MQLTKNEKELLTTIIETWQIEGCPYIDEWCWGRDERDVHDQIREGDDRVGSKIIQETIAGLEKKLKIKF